MNGKHKVLLFLEMIEHLENLLYTLCNGRWLNKKQFSHDNFLFPLQLEMLIAHTEGKDGNMVCNNEDIENLSIKEENILTS